MRDDHDAPREQAQPRGPSADPEPGGRGGRLFGRPSSPEPPPDDRQPKPAQDGGPEDSPPPEPPAAEGFGQISDPGRDAEARRARQAERRAYRNITGETVFTGPVTIGRDLRLQLEQQWEGPSTGRLAQSDLEELRQCFAPPPDYRQAERVLDERHLLVLRGRTGWGKGTMAVHLLTSAVADGGEIRRLEPDLDLRRLEADSFEPGWAYLVDTLSHERVERLDFGFHLGRLSELLKQRRAWFVITVSDRVELPADIPDHLKLECVDPPDEDAMVGWRLDMLERHVRRRADAPDPERLRAALAAASAHLGTRPPPRYVVYLANLLAPLVEDAPATDEPFEARLEQVFATFKNRGREVAERWFMDHRDTADQAFRLALAVFNGESYQSTLDAATELEPLLEQAKGKRKAARRPLFDSRRSDRLAQAEARVDTWLEPTDVGWARIELVELHNPALPSALLDLVWHEYDRVRRPLLTWLKGLGGRQPIETRARAAAAVGMLSTYGFRYVYNDVLASWAASDDERQREAAAWALGVPAADPELAPLVLRLVRRWATDPKMSLAVKWTAAAAYGSEMGLRFPEAALAGLRRIAKEETPGLTLVVADSVLNLFKAGHHDAVLEALVAWTEAEEPTIRLERGVAAFLRLLMAARTDVGLEGGSWPMLLAMTDDRQRRDPIVTLWRRTLDLGPPAADLGLEELRRWCRAAEDDGRLFDLLKEFLDVLAQRPRDRERLVFVLRGWANRQRRRSRTAARLLSGLDQGRRQ